MFLGTCGALPPVGRDAPCFPVNRRILVDTGWYAADRLLAYGMDPVDIDTVMITHSHCDHYLALPQILLCLACSKRRREGKPPAQPSRDFAHAGHCVMRDKWGPEGHVLIFDAGCFGAGHQHEDKLNFVYYAGGRELIGDPGIYSYKRDELEPCWRGTWSHNSIVIDGLSQCRKLGPREKVPDPDRPFVIGDGFDFAVGWYRHAYSPRQAALWGRSAKSDSQAAIRDVEHQRCVFYVKGEYAILCDRVVGKGEHQIDILFHPAPILTGADVRREVRAAQLETRKDGAVVTKEREHANVAIIPAQGESLEVLDLIGQKDPVRGRYAPCGIRPSHDIVYRCRRQLPAHFETVIQPLPAGDATAMKVEAVRVECNDAKHVAAIACGDDLFLSSYDGPAKMQCRDVGFEAQHCSYDTTQRAQQLRHTWWTDSPCSLAGRCSTPQVYQRPLPRLICGRPRPKTKSLVPSGAFGQDLRGEGRSGGKCSVTRVREQYASALKMRCFREENNDGA